jgi:hypothetical protein
MNIYERQGRALYQPGAKPQETIAIGNKGLKARTIAGFATTSAGRPGRKA